MNIQTSQLGTEAFHKTKTEKEAILSMILDKLQTISKNRT